MTTFGSAQVRSATAPRARPMPDPPTPPHGSCGALRATRWSFIHTMPDPQLAGDARALVAVGRPHRRAEAERCRRWRRAIASSSVSTAVDAQHRAGDLLARDPHRRGDAGQHGGGVEPAAEARRPSRARRSAASRPARPPRRRAAATRSSRSRRVSGPISVPGVAAGRRSAARRAPATTPLEEAVVRPRAARTRARRCRRTGPRWRTPPRRRRRPRAARRRRRSTSIASLPPISSTLRLSARAHASPTSRPASSEPVKRTWATGASTTARAGVAWPWTIMSSPSGRPARAKTRAMRSPASAACGDGLSTTPLPAISATATSPSGVANGSAAGPSTATTPERLVGPARPGERAQRARDGDLLAGQDAGAGLGQPLQRLDRGQDLHQLDLGPRPALLGADQLLDLAASSITACAARCM